jgi:hypothetical protein
MEKRGWEELVRKLRQEEILQSTQAIRAMRWFFPAKYISFYVEESLFKSLSRFKAKKGNKDKKYLKN